MYLVISFDFCGSSDVKIHAFLEELSCAKEVFDRVKQNNTDDESFQLQLIKLEKFQSDKGVTLFWDNKLDNNITSIANLNTDEEI